MTHNAIIRRMFLAGLTGLLVVACRDDRAALPDPVSATGITLKLESPAFAEEGFIPADYTCDGQNISPALTWDAPPAATRSLALIMDDPDASNGTFVHWVLYDLPAAARELPQAVPTQPLLVDGGTQGKNDFGDYGYGGACPPNGTHRYVFQLYALDTILDLAPGATKAEAIAAMQGRVIATGKLVGRYQRQ
jgi:Raf kinase inhibitor-like YbhB/YbcL family protein